MREALVCTVSVVDLLTFCLFHHLCAPAVCFVICQLYLCSLLIFLTELCCRAQVGTQAFILNILHGAERRSVICVRSGGSGGDWVGRAGSETMLINAVLGSL